MGIPGGCHSPVIQVADTGSFMTAVPRHWDDTLTIVIPQRDLEIT
ncbi:hypothetical protein [Wolbachia pipientis]|nr:hypothetical protein [Wolbachia pipientis]